jgi:hypothetical protein
MAASKHWLLCGLNNFKMKSKKLQMTKDPMHKKLKKTGPEEDNVTITERNVHCLTIQKMQKNWT